MTNKPTPGTAAHIHVSRSLAMSKMLSALSVCRPDGILQTLGLHRLMARAGIRYQTTKLFRADLTRKTSNEAGEAGDKKGNSWNSTNRWGECLTTAWNNRHCGTDADDTETKPGDSETALMFKGGGKQTVNIHHLKTVQPWFDYVVSGKKTFEVRKNDRDFRAGDILILHEYLPRRYPDPTEQGEREIGVLVDIVLYDEDIKGIQPGYCVMGISKVDSGS